MKTVQGSRHLVYPVCAPLAQALASQYPGPYTSIPLSLRPSKSFSSDAVAPTCTSPEQGSAGPHAPQAALLSLHEPWQDAADHRGPAGLASTRSVTSTGGSSPDKVCQPSIAVPTPADVLVRVAPASTSADICDPTASGVAPAPGVLGQLTEGEVDLVARSEDVEESGHSSLNGGHPHACKVAAATASKLADSEFMPVSQTQQGSSIGDMSKRQGSIKSVCCEEGLACVAEALIDQENDTQGEVDVLHGQSSMAEHHGVGLF
jgi:hypothetical protein